MNIYLHNGSLGDLIYGLPTIKILGKGVILTKQPFVDTLRDLLMVQSYISDVQVYDKYYWRKKTNSIINLDVFRNESLNNPTKHLSYCHSDLFGISVDITIPWLDNVEPIKMAPIVVNRSCHYHSTSKTFDWMLLEKYKKDFIFVGTKRELIQFNTRKFIINDVLTAKDALELAGIIKGAKLFVGNQSFCFALAESMKCPRILEVCERRPNCMPHGKYGTTILSDESIQYYLSI